MDAGTIPKIQEDCTANEMEIVTEGEFMVRPE